ncbi:prepilin peptidase [Paenibacillus solisilvae]|uniref:Prepilin peptidase n=1 Tax=Paenibacillus solisilvae TaxID=2486751 RepID=A0ABW0VRW2_9BACL
MAATISILAASLLLVIAFIHDVRVMKIPNRLTISFIIAGIIYQSVVYGMSGSIHSFLGAAAGFIPLLVLYALKGIGAGDVKLFAALGAWIGASLVVQVLIYAILYAGAAGVVLIFVNGSFGRRVMRAVISMITPSAGGKVEAIKTWSKDGLRFPFMIAVVPAALTAWFQTV